jgi:hypothetical protein
MNGFNLKNKKIYTVSGLIFFIYSLVVGVAIQIFIVPNFFPQFDLGDGLVVLDSSGFNQIAKIKATEILNKGWVAWELRPEAQSPAGIASFFYVFLIAKPISMLPFNALVHALSGCLIIWLLLHIFSWRASVFGASLFILNPQALQWVAAIHRDGIFIFGNLLFLVCMIWFLDALKKPKLKSFLYAFTCGMVGTALVWLARPYFVQVITVYLIFGIIIISISFLIMCCIKKVVELNYYFLLFLLFTLCIISFQVWVIKFHTSPSYDLPAGTFGVLVDVDGSSVGSSGSSGSVESTGSAGSVGVLFDADRSKKIKKEWISVEWVPDSIERKLYTMFISRRGAINTGGYTVVDAEIPLNNALEFVRYFPRALQIGLLSPFPYLWWEEASTPVMNLARKVMGVTTFIFYFFYLGLFIGILSRWKNLVMWLTFSFCFLGILVFSYTYPNIGTLLRFRYGFYMLLIAFGAACIFEITERFLKRGKLNMITKDS